MSAVARTMLVIDTDPQVRASLHPIGRELGLAVSFADSLREALAAMQTRSFDVLVVAHELPDAGVDLASAIDALQAADERAAIVVVLPSEDGDAVAAAYRKGAEDVLTLPLNPHELSAAIERTFGPVPVQPKVASRDRLN